MRHFFMLAEKLFTLVYFICALVNTQWWVPVVIHTYIILIMIPSLDLLVQRYVLVNAIIRAYSMARYYLGTFQSTTSTKNAIDKTTAATKLTSNNICYDFNWFFWLIIWPFVLSVPTSVRRIYVINYVSIMLT